MNTLTNPYFLNLYILNKFFFFKFQGGQTLDPPVCVVCSTKEAHVRILSHECLAQVPKASRSLLLIRIEMAF